MRTSVSRRLTPSFVLSVVAVFLAAGGTALATGERTSANQPRCANGAVRGIAFVTGDAAHGLENLSADWTTDARLFGGRFNCARGTVAVRRAGGPGAFELRFPNNGAGTAVASGVGSQLATSAERIGPGTFRVTLRAPGTDGTMQLSQRVPFVVVVF